MASFHTDLRRIGATLGQQVEVSLGEIYRYSPTGVFGQIINIESATSTGYVFEMRYVGSPTNGRDVRPFKVELPDDPLSRARVGTLKVTSEHFGDWVFDG